MRWTSDGLRNRQYEADVVPIDADGKVVALGSCKWSVGEHQAGELDKLETVAKMLRKDGLLASETVPLLFFDRTGFSERLREVAAERDDVHLITTSQLEPADG